MTLTLTLIGRHCFTQMNVRLTGNWISINQVLQFNAIRPATQNPAQHIYTATEERGCFIISEPNKDNRSACMRQFRQLGLIFRVWSWTHLSRRRILLVELKHTRYIQRERERERERRGGGSRASEVGGRTEFNKKEDFCLCLSFRFLPPVALATLLLSANMT